MPVKIRREPATNWFIGFNVSTAQLGSSESLNIGAHAGLDDGDDDNDNEDDDDDQRIR